MAVHYVRSAHIAQNPTSNRPERCVAAYLFHWLRCVGWNWVWEGDGEQGQSAGDPAPYEDVNHIPDGNMEAAGVANWTVTGTGSVAKDTSTIKSGTQSLRFDADAADVLTSANWTQMHPTNVSLGGYNPYDCGIWIYNDSGQTFSADIVGGGSSIQSTTGPVSLISTGGWAFYHIGFTIGNGVETPFANAQLEITAPGTTATIYVDWALGFTSQYEWNNAAFFDSGTDGDVQNGNEFNSASHSFIGGDVGRFICAFDAANPENSGIYEIVGISGSNAVLDLRVGGSEVLTNTSASSIVWRLVYYDADWGDSVKTGGELNARSHSGWMLESPHASKQRLFVRGYTSGTARRTYLSGSPEECDFDPTTGRFYKSGRSINKNRNMFYGEISGSDGPGFATHPDGVKMWAMAESDGSYVLMSTEDENDGSAKPSGFGVGFTGVDANHPTPEDWVLLHQTATSAFNQWDRFGIVTKEQSTVGSFTMIDRNGYAQEACMPLFGTSGSTDIEEEANAGADPFDGEEQLYAPIIWRSPDGIAGRPSEKVCADIPVFWGRPNMTQFTPFNLVAGSNSAFSLSGTTITFTAGSSVFTADMVGKEIVVTGATSPGNDGTFVITSFISGTQVTYENAGGATEAGAGTFTAYPQHIHIGRGMMWPWNGFTVP